MLRTIRTAAFDADHGHQAMNNFRSATLRVKYFPDEFDNLSAQQKTGGSAVDSAWRIATLPRMNTSFINPALSFGLPPSRSNQKEREGLFKLGHASEIYKALVGLGLIARDFVTK
jgi:hypothetical protein